MIRPALNVRETDLESDKVKAGERKPSPEGCVSNLKVCCRGLGRLGMAVENG
jgi:hypothetical protein